MISFREEVLDYNIFHNLCCVPLVGNVGGYNGGSDKINVNHLQDARNTNWYGTISAFNVT